MQDVVSAYSRELYRLTYDTKHEWCGDPVTLLFDKNARMQVDRGSLIFTTEAVAVVIDINAAWMILDMDGSLDETHSYELQRYMRLFVENFHELVPVDKIVEHNDYELEDKINYY